MKHLIWIAPLLLAACGGHGHDHGPDGHSHGDDGAHAHEPGPNGGEMLEVGDHAAHLEVLHGDDGLRLHLWGEDGETPVEADRAPELKVQGPDGPLVLTATAADGGFRVPAADLEGIEVDGRVTVYLGGKTYNVDVHADH